MRGFSPILNPWFFGKAAARWLCTGQSLDLSVHGLPQKARFGDSCFVLSRNQPFTPLEWSFVKHHQANGTWLVVSNHSPISEEAPVLHFLPGMYFTTGSTSSTCRGSNPILCLLTQADIDSLKTKSPAHRIERGLSCSSYELNLYHSFPNLLPC